MIPAYETTFQTLDGSRRAWNDWAHALCREATTDRGVDMTKPKIACSRLADRTWEWKGLRRFLEYRDRSGVAASDGRFGANAGRAIQAHGPGSGGAS
jgi:hypothetical protein